MTYRTLADEVIRELQRAQRKFAPFNSAHEGYAVILEELEELWEEARKNPKKVYGSDPAGPAKHRAAMREEAIQLAAMGLRFVVDVCGALGTANETYGSLSDPPEANKK